MDENFPFDEWFYFFFRYIPRVVELDEAAIISWAVGTFWEQKTHKSRVVIAAMEIKLNRKAPTPLPDPHAPLPFHGQRAPEKEEEIEKLKRVCM